MKNFEQMGLAIPEILLPKNIDTNTWSVVACDQFTQDRDYWKQVEQTAGTNPSTLNIILPEVYLNDPDKPERIQKVKKTMNEYIEQGVFDSPKKEFIYIERKTAYGRTRKGLMACIDLDSYEWKPFSKALIRATEATILDRIPPRMEIRRGAPVESPHIMLLVNDPEKVVVEGTGKNVKANGTAPCYSGNLMHNSGSITGWPVADEESLKVLNQALNKVADKNTDADGNTFMFAVGDGNHSLATAKAIWDEFKEKNGGVKDADGYVSIPAGLENHNARYALIEIVNIYDDGLTFEPIHRVLFYIINGDLIKKIADELNGTLTDCAGKDELAAAVKNSNADFGFVYLENGVQKFTLLKTPVTELAVSRLQPVIDDFLKTAPDGHVCDDKGCRIVKPEIDYIHGTDEVFRLGAKENAMSILLPPVAKDSFFATINSRGPLPRKSFSMGEADEKRFYLECRKLF